MFNQICIKMSESILYGYSKKDIEDIIEIVIERLRKTDLISDDPTSIKEDRLTQKEAAELMGVSVQCLIKWKRKKIVPFYQVGGSIYYSKKELWNWPGRIKSWLTPPKDNSNGH